MRKIYWFIIVTALVFYGCDTGDGDEIVNEVTEETEPEPEPIPEPPGKAITAFSFGSPAASGTIDGTAVFVAVPPFTPLAGLVPAITVSPGAQVEPPSGTGQDFSVPVTYTVTSEDGSAAEYTVTVMAVCIDMAGVAAYLAEPAGGEEGTASDPVPLPVRLFLQDAEGNGWAELLQTIQGHEKYVELDLSACTMSANAKGVMEFDPGGANTGESFITALTLPDAAESIKAGTISGNRAALFRHFTAMKTIRGDNVVTIGDFVFNAAVATAKDMVLTTATFPHAQTVGSYAFAYCIALTTLSLESVTALDYMAFRGCTALAEVSLPCAERIGGEAFRNCTALQTLFLPNAVSLGPCLFEGTGGQKALTLTLGSPAPTLKVTSGTGMFGTPAAIVSETVYGKSVTIKIPAGATGYDTAWQNKFKVGLSGSTPAYEEITDNG